MFVEYTQNNSYGRFDVDDKLCHRLIIEGNTLVEARDKALELGIYFDGVEKGWDCPCCGDRWYDERSSINMMRIQTAYVKENINTLEEYMQYLADEYGMTTPDIRVYYLDGTIKEFFKKEKANGKI